MTTPRTYTGQDLVSLNGKLLTFYHHLTAGEQAAFSVILHTARTGLPEVVGYDTGDMLTKIDWDTVAPLGTTGVPGSQRGIPTPNPLDIPHIPTR